jgi:hypothetical protein
MCNVGLSGGNLPLQQRSFIDMSLDDLILRRRIDYAHRKPRFGSKDISV